VNTNCQVDVAADLSFRIGADQTSESRVGLWSSWRREATKEENKTGWIGLRKTTSSNGQPQSSKQRGAWLEWKEHRQCCVEERQIARLLMRDATKEENQT
jgi:hypothetical protein